MNQKPNFIPTRDSEVIVLGIGGHAKVVISTLRAMGYHVVEAYDDDASLWGTNLLGVPVVGPLETLVPAHRPAVIGFGDNHVRQRVASELPLKWLTAVHPSATVHPSVRLGVGTVVFAGAVVQPDVKLGDHIIINTGATVDHDCELGDFVHISPGANLAGSVRVGEGAFLGIGSAVIPHIHIGAWTTVGAGSVVVRDLAAGVIAKGAPAHHDTRPNPEAFVASVAPQGVLPVAVLEAVHSDLSPAVSPDETPIAASGQMGEFIMPDDARWAEILAQVPHDFYHLPAYVQLEARQSGGEAMAFYARRGNAQFLIPLILKRPPFSRDISPAWKDATSPYGYAHPLMSVENDEEDLDFFLNAFREVATGHNIVTAFLRLHPLMPLPREPLEKYGQLLQHGQTVYFDLTESDEEISQAICRNHRRDVEKLGKAGFQVVFNQWEYYQDFVNLYRSTMERLNADDMYFFRGDYFKRLRRALDSSMNLAIVLSPQGKVAAGGLFIQTGEIVQYHLSGAAEGFTRQSPTKIMVDWAARHWAKEPGQKYLHVGGGVGGSAEDSLFAFKAGFARHRADFFTYRMVLDPPKYQQLTARWREAGGQVEDAGTFFPLYGRPIN